MGPKSHATRVAFRRAVWASLALHAVVVSAGAVVFFAAEERERAGPRTSTVVDEPQVRISQTEVTFAVSAPPALPAKPQAGLPPIPVPAEPQLPAPPPLAAARPQSRTLPPELVALIRKPAAAPVGAVEVPVAPDPPFVDPNVAPAGGAAANPPPASAIHGPLAAGHTVVYILDCSGSMGAAGKFDAARAALVATLAQQPATVRFQVIVYAGAAKPLLASDGKGLPATAANVWAASERLAVLEPRGNSDHLGAVRAAIAFRPDVILMLTDADDLSGAAVKSVTKAVPVRLVPVTAAGVQPPCALK